jgi:hypothetical protein
MALPKINLWSDDSTQIRLVWNSNPATDGIYAFNLYGCATYNGTYTLLQSHIPNSPNKLTPGSVLVSILRSSIPINTDQPYYFTITSLTSTGTESAQGPFIAVDALADVFKERINDAYNPVYKDIIIPMCGGIMCTNIEQLLGRPANYVEVYSATATFITFNSSTNDQIPIAAGVRRKFDRQTITVSSICVGPGSGNVEVFVSGL